MQRFVIKRLASVLVTTLAATGCAGPTALPFAKRTPSEWSIAKVENPVTETVVSTSSDDAQWWASFNDPLLASLIESSKQHPSIEEAVARWKQASAVLDSKLSAQRPQVDAGASASQDRSVSKGLTKDTSTGAAQLGASWEIDVFGRIKDSVNAAEKNAVAAKHAIEQTKVAMAAGTATTYLNLIQCLALTRSYADELSSYKLEAQILSARESVGLVTDTNTANFDISVRRAATTLNNQTAQCKQFKLALIELTGWSVEKLDKALSARGYAIPELMVAKPKSTPATVLERRPDVQAAIAAVLSAEASAQAAEKNQLPRISLTGVLGLTNVSTALITSSLTQTSLASAVSWNLFSGGRLKAERSQAQAVLNEKSATLDRVIRNAVFEVEAALVDEAKSSRARKDYEASLANALRTLNTIEAKEKVGLVSSVVLTQAKRDYELSNRSVIIAKAQQALANVALYKSLGGVITSNVSSESQP